MSGYLNSEDGTGRTANPEEKESEPDMTLTIIICAILGVTILAVVITQFGWSISTQHRDHGAAGGGPMVRRRIISRRRPRNHAGPVNPEAIPSEPIPGQASDLSVGITDEQG